MNLSKRLVLLIVAMSVATLAFAAGKAADLKPIQIVLIGDSTVASYTKPPADRPDLTGWGQVFGALFGDKVTILNHARSSRSSKSFIREGLWKDVLASKPDYVFIQFGHNDCPGKGDRSTDPNTDFQDYLRQYIDEARAAETKPILVTPVARRTFEDGKITTNLQPYADAMIKVATEKGVPVIDLHAASMAMFDRLGDLGSADMSAAAGDRTHFSGKGARAMARLVATALPVAVPELMLYLTTSHEKPASLWDLAKAKALVHRFSTLFPAHDVRDHLSCEEGIAAAIDWCRRTAVTKVYIEVFRSGYQAEATTLRYAKERFLAAGFEVSGCVTTTDVGKTSKGWKLISCYTDQPTQQHLQRIFEDTAALFDEIMIDDFWFTDCTCPECDAARRAKTVAIGDRTYLVAGDTWEDYRCELMVRLSQQRVLAAAKRVNPKVRLIIKYPQWYDQFHERGYEVLRETADFDRIWVGTETRNYNDKRWGGTPQYEAYFIMRWLSGIGGPKCGGGWYDPYGTTERTYIEQARQTVLAGAHESLLFCYGSLLKDTGPKNIESLRQNIPELFAVAEEVGRRQTVGVAAYKPANSHSEKERKVFDFVGMLGIPLVPCHEFPADAQAAFLSVHAMKDPELPAKLSRFIASDKPVLVTDDLKERLTGKVDLDRDNVHVLPVNGEPKRLLELSQNEADSLRAFLLQPLGHAFQAPARVGLYLFADGSWVIENFNDELVTTNFDGKQQQVPPRGWIMRWK